MSASSGPYRDGEFRITVQTPRAVPLSLRLSLLLGGWRGGVGWGIFGVGFLLAGIFIPMSDAVAYFHFRGELVRTQGLVTSSTSSGVRENKQVVWKLNYTFVDEKGQPQHGRSYLRGRLPNPDSPVTIEYEKGNPSVSRIQGGRMRPMHAAVAFVALPTLVGLVFIVLAFVHGRRALNLLRHGKPALGRLVDTQQTRVRINKRYVYKLEFEFEADGQQHRTTARTHELEKLNEAREPLLYHPLDPTQATMLDHLPGSPRLVDGKLAAAGTGGVLAALLPPLFAIASGLTAFAITSAQF